jgi:type IV pilus assembly protein PilY1
MKAIVSLMRSFAANRGARWVGVPVVLAAAVAAVISQSAATLPPTTNLAAEPLYARGARAKPTLTLALSVEFPTVGAQYRPPTVNAVSDDTYSPSTAYVGYYDTESCYTYNNDATPGLRRFERSGAATSRTCGGTGFSGNFMNWATSSAIDVLRFGLSGGDRVVDTASLTVLQRAVLPNATISTSFWNRNYFPSKRLPPALVAGALPAALVGSYAGDVFISNCLNRVHFGTQATPVTGSGGATVPGPNCEFPGENSLLGVTAPQVAALDAVTDHIGFLPADFTPCAVLGGSCVVTGTMQVAYGSEPTSVTQTGATWKFKRVSNTTVTCNNSSPNGFGANPATGATARSCFVRAAPAATTPMTADGFFYARVQVCESSSGVLSDPRTNFCLRYPAGNYKPVGNLQKYSDRLRVAAFGYLNDRTGNPNERYGGVLRAPMKYVGPKQFDANFALQSGTNPVAEWDESTGVFASNPQGQSAILSGADSSPPGQYLSGVTNYLNQFGRTGINGQYKGFDPVGELYYESLRYLQGLSPTPEAVSGLTDTLRDGFPVYDSWLSTAAPDPHPAVAGMNDYSCVKNNIVGIGDVFTHWDKSIPGNNNRAVSPAPNDFVRSDNLTGNEPNFHYWTQVVGGFESNNTVAYIDGEGVAQPAASAPMNIASNAPYNTARWGMEDQTTGSGGGATAPDLSSAYYMAGVAYWANTHDIRGTQWSNTAAQRPGMRVTTYMIDVNENSASNDATARTNSHFYLTAKYGGFKDTSGTGNPFTEKRDDGTLADNNNNWAGANGEAKNYFLASSAQALLDALDSIFANIASEANSIAGGAISTQRLTTSGGQIYQAQFDPADWSGDLIAYPVTVSASGVVDIGVPAGSPWRNSANVAVGAAGKLDDLATTGVAGGIDARKIYVGYNSTAVTPVFGTTEFKWSSLDTTTQDALRQPPYAASAPMDAASVGQARLDYLRGDRIGEGAGVFRRRGSRLGDIVNSGVAFSGAPPALRFADSAYASFQASNKDRKKALFVGANDGMMHAFDADTGSELFAYIPSWLVPRLPDLASTAYVHAAYADGSPAVAEAKVGSAWKTVLVSGTGGGGQGVFALDVSDPDAFDDSKVMWEFTDRHDADMGNVIGHPKILKFNVGAGTATPDYKYFAVFASGVNNYANDGYRAACAVVDDGYCGAPALFFLDLSKNKTDPWVLGTNYYKVRFPVRDSLIASGMTEFAVRLGAAEEVTYLYAGDLQGNLWKLDVTQAASGTLADLSYFKDGTEPIPMFVAEDAASNRQPITMEPALVFGTNRSIIVSFGTGKYLENSDNAGPYKAQSVYSILDNNSPVADTATSPAAAIASRNRLASATTADAAAVDFPAFTWGRATSDTGTIKSGWYFDFFNSDTVDDGDGVPEAGERAGSGERQISGMAVLAGRLVFGSVIPALNSCDNGKGNLYVVDIRGGDTTILTSTVGILGEPFLAQVGASTLTGSDTTGRRQETTRYQIILQGSAGLAAPPSLGMDVVTFPGRLSWREIGNYQELKSGP